MPRNCHEEFDDYSAYSDLDANQENRHSRASHPEHVLSGARWQAATGGRILRDPMASVYRQDWDETLDDSQQPGGFLPPEPRSREHPAPDSEIDKQYDAPELNAPQISTDDFVKDRVYHIDSNHERIRCVGDSNYLLDDLSGTIYQTFVPETVRSNDDWALYHLCFERLSRRSPITIDFAYAGSLDPNIPTHTYKSTHEPGYARIKSLVEKIKEADPPFDRSMSFRESQVCLKKLGRAARKTGERMRAEGSIQIEKLVSVCPKEDHEQGEDRWSHSAWVSVKPLIRM
jgi:hypothetical protein